MKTTTNKAATQNRILVRVQAVGRVPATFGTIATGETVRVSRADFGGRHYHVALDRADGFRVVLATDSTVEAAECVAALLAA